MIGLDRTARGHEAGLRTTILVGLAASVAMILANLLLPLEGKTPQSFAVMDVMRLPLGILTGMGFIGGGAILKRGDLVSGVTTAATLWLVTVIGLCFGGGEIALGLAATGLGVLIIWAMKALDARIPRRQRAILTVSGPPEAARKLPGLVAPSGYRARLIEQENQEQQTRLKFEIMWSGAERASAPLDFLDLVESRFALISFRLETDIDP